MEHVIRSMGNSGVIGGKDGDEGDGAISTGSSFRINRINKTDGSVAPLMNHANR